MFNRKKINNLCRDKKSQIGCATFYTDFYEYYKLLINFTMKIKISNLFSLMLMAASMFLFLGGCRKDEVATLKNDLVENRSDISGSGYFPSDHFLFNRPESDGCAVKFPKETWDPVSVIRAFEIYNHVKCEGKLNVKNFGEPKWNSTIYYKINSVEYTFTPLTDQNLQLTSGFFTKSSDQGLVFSFKDKSNTKTDAILWGLFGPRIKCADWTDNLWDKTKDFFESIFGNIYFGGGWGNGGSAGSGFIYTGTSGTASNGGDGGNTGGTGGGSSGSTGYVNPMGFAYSCDLELTTVEGCDKFFEDTWGFQNIESIPNIKEKIATCGCYRAVLHTGNWSNKSEGQKCLDCLGGSGFSNAGWADIAGTLEAAVENLEFPCVTLDDNLKDKINKLKEEVYNAACQTLRNPKSQFSPGKLLADFLNGLNSLGETYISKGGPNFYNHLSAASVDIAKLGALTGMTPSQIAKLSNEDLCKMISIAECLEPTSFEGGLSNSQKFELVEWWNSKKNDKLSAKVLQEYVCNGGDLGSNGNIKLFAESHYMHNTMMQKYSNYVNANVDIDQFLITHGVDVYLATVALYENYIKEVGITPTDPYQWQLMMEVFIVELGPIALELIPGGIGDMIGAYNSFHAGDYWQACLGVVLVVVPGDEIIKVWQKYDDIKKGMKAVLKFINIYQKLAGLPGVQKVFSKLPQVWKDLPGSKLADGNGLRWVKSQSHHFRIMEPDLNSPWPSQNVPYAKFHKGNSHIDINGNPVAGDSPDAHIPVSLINDTFLDNFFN